MRRLLFRITGLCLAPLVGLALVHGSELDGKPSVPGPVVRPVKPIKTVQSVITDKTAATCGSHGTQVDFVDTPSQAAKIAKKEQKLVFVLHVSGNFEDPRFT
ncbi:MAG TPA: hypothetical protein VN688_31280 [Gemmataceae bacterium]|nr:hypothetical protein [Gemmataceae bacterium]